MNKFAEISSNKDPADMVPHSIEAEQQLLGGLLNNNDIFYSLKSYFKTRNKYQLSALLFILCSLIPFLPSGSFFSTYTSVLFWLNFAIMTSYNKDKI